MRTVILAGGAGKRLFPLTEDRSKPAVPLGGKYRLIDVPISNSIHSGLRRIFVLTQFNSASLNRHVTSSFNFDPFEDSFVEVLAAEQTMSNVSWFQGTADAVRQHLPSLTGRDIDYHLILAGDQLYRMDYQGLLRAHWDMKADVTVCAIPCTEEAAPSFGLIQVDEERRVVRFLEKPGSEALAGIRSDMTLHGYDAERAKERPYLASMGIYLFNTEVLVDALSDTTMNDFGHQVLPRAILDRDVRAYLFDGYWEDLGTIAAFYKANIDLTRSREHFDFHGAGLPIFTRARFLPPSRIDDACEIRKSIVTEGAVLSDARLDHSVVGIRSVIRPGAVLEETLMMGADYYEDEADFARNRKAGAPDVGIGTGSVIRRAIIDKNARIGSDVKILNESGVPHRDGDGYYIRDGIVIIPKDGIVPSGTVV